MKTLAIALTVVIGLGLAGMGTPQAEAAAPFGIHVGGGGVHVDVGRAYYGGFGYRGISRYRTPFYRGHYDYHNTSHLDYHPGRYTRHRNHFDYNRGHFDVHRTGHYDYQHGGYGHHGW